MWESYYRLAKEYYIHNGNLLIPTKFKTSDGVTYDENGINLGVWMKNQRDNFSSLEEGRQRLLQDIDLTLSYNNDAWQEKYKLAKAYYETYGNLLIRADFKTSDGITYDEDGISLGRWVINQKRDFSNMSEERQNLLESIGIEFRTREDMWISNYKLAKTYYETYGNLFVPERFKTSNGSTYDEEGISLGVWVVAQRVKYSKLSKERQQLLKSIGFVLNPRKNKKEITNVCENYNIDYSLNKKVLSHISLQELLSKIEFLNEQNLPLVDSDNILIDIFSMSSTDMKEKYGVSLCEAIDLYSNKKEI